VTGGVKADDTLRGDARPILCADDQVAGCQLQRRLVGSEECFGVGPYAPEVAGDTRPGQRPVYPVIRAEATNVYAGIEEDAREFSVQTGRQDDGVRRGVGNVLRLGPNSR